MQSLHVASYTVIINRMLQKYINLLTDGKAGLNIFVPLCGKSVDLKWYISNYRVMYTCDNDEAIASYLKESMEFHYKNISSLAYTRGCNILSYLQHYFLLNMAKSCFKYFIQHLQIFPNVLLEYLLLQ